MENQKFFYKNDRTGSTLSRVNQENLRYFYRLYCGFVGAGSLDAPEFIPRGSSSLLLKPPHPCGPELIHLIPRA